MQWFPIIGSILLTAVILWVGISTYVGNRRKIGQAVAGTYIRSTCCGATSTPLDWSQDGWISTCDTCGTIQYLGDDYDNPPPGFALHSYAEKPTLELRVEDRVTPALNSVAESIRKAINPAEVTSEEALRLRDDYREQNADIAGLWQDDGEPLTQPAMPNIGGEGHPEYKGPHYIVPHDRFVPYDVLRDPPKGAAVHIVGNVACVGPLEAEGDMGHADPIREEDES